MQPIINHIQILIYLDAILLQQVRSKQTKTYFISAQFLSFNTLPLFLNSPPFLHTKSVILTKVQFRILFLQLQVYSEECIINKIVTNNQMEQDIPHFGDYKTIKVVGKGTFGSVYLVQNKQGTMFAVKHVLQDKRYKNRELQITSKLKHPNIVKLKQHFEETIEGKHYLNLVLEYLPENLSQKLRICKIQGKFLSNELIKTYAHQLLKSLQYLQESNVCHRDIKPSNILINGKQLKLCDFGSAKCLVEGEKNISYICSRYYRAPQLIFSATLYSNQVDVWSAACVIAEMVINKPLFEGENSTNQLVKILKILGTPTVKDLKGMKAKDPYIQLPPIQPLTLKKYLTKLNPNVEPQLIDLLNKMLVFDPNRRLTAQQALNQIYFLQPMD